MPEVLSTIYPPITARVQLNVIVNIESSTKPGSGSGFIQGVVTLKGTPEPNAIVSLFEEESGIRVKTITASSSGLYRFDNLDTTLKYFIIVKEPSGLWEYRVQSRITPVI